MINEVIFMKGYGLYVWSAFLFTLISFAALYTLIKINLVKEQNKFTAKFGLLDKEKVFKITSIIAVLGAINVPIIKFSVDWWSTLHQNSSINILSESTIHPTMLVPLLLMTAAFSLFSLLIFLMKYNTELIKIKNKGLDRL